ncbi:MAG: chorismate-binding protein [bacterium]|nr:chorismate-binding protein [bacterium]
MPEKITAIFTRPGGERNRLERLAFGAARAIWSARTDADVRACLDIVAEQQSCGRYVIGLITYEAARASDRAHAVHPPSSLPLAWFAAYDEPIEWTGSAGEFTLGEPRVQTSREDYCAAVRQSLAHIRAGDVYQVNFTVRARCDFSGDALAAFDQLSRAVPMPYSAFVNTGATQIISLSPELFLRRQGSTLSTSPMKGTAGRRPSWDDDEFARLRLEQSEKDRAENTMIVDLMRNDLGRVCTFGSVSVPECAEHFAIRPCIR